MAKYGSNSLVFEFDNSGGTLVDMTQHTLELGGVEIEGSLPARYLAPLQAAGIVPNGRHA